jgi:Ni/Fe-hydrogenase subunit HybB-like protein
MSNHVLVHSPVSGKLMTAPFKALLAVAGLGALVALYRFLMGIGAVSAHNDGYPWGIWIVFIVVVGTAIGCGGYAVGLLVYILNRGKYHPLVRPALLTGLLGYGLAVLAVIIDLGRFWGLWKVPIFFWRWTHSPQLEVALCVAAYILVLLVELSPALFEKWQSSPSTGLRAWAERGLRFVDRRLVWILPLGLLLPTMHQSSLGTMMLLPGPRVHPLWFTPWLPFLFLVNCIVIGYAVVVLESSFSRAVFGRKRETAMLASLSHVAAWVALFWVAFRLVEVAVAGKLPLIASATGIAFLGEILILAVGALILLSKQRRAQPMWQVRAAILLLLAGALFRVNTYLVAFSPGPHWSYFPTLPELLITFGIVAFEILLYIAAVKTLPILSGTASPAAEHTR